MTNENFSPMLIRAVVISNDDGANRVTTGRASTGRNDGQFRTAVRGHSGYEGHCGYEQAR